MPRDPVGMTGVERFRERSMRGAALRRAVCEWYAAERTRGWRNSTRPSSRADQALVLGGVEGFRVEAETAHRSERSRRRHRCRSRRRRGGRGALVGAGAPIDAPRLAPASGRPVSGLSSGAKPCSWASVKTATVSSIASGLPRVSTTIRSRTCATTDLPAPSISSRAASGASPFSSSVAVPRLIDPWPMRRREEQGDALRPEPPPGEQQRLA